MFRRILDHERDAVATYLVSASPVEIVGPVARALGMSGGALATTAAVDGDGIYTGELVGPFCYGAGKVTAIEAEAARVGIDLGRSWAYSDSASDLPMLGAVGNPVAVNPDKKLRDVARESEWEILRTEARHGLRAIVAAGIVTGGAGVGIGTAMLLRRLNRRS
ncbi:MAG: HAD-IB family hydrolase [Acidimicrobiia bacterium]|nr:HAD-IB family hydrolase [Acidimicrobiia bacterium]